MSLWWYGVGVAAVAILFWRLVLPSMSTTATTSAGASSATGAAAKAKALWAEWGEYAMSIVLVIAGIVVLSWGIFGGASWGGTSPTELGKWSQGVWIPILILWGVLAALVAIHATGSVAKTLQAILATTAILVVVVFPLWNWATSDRLSDRAPSDCTYSRPCEPAKELIAVPTGKKPCFDPPIWADKKRFGFSVTTTTEPKEHPYRCTAEQVQLGRCTEGPISAFRFNPEARQKAPRHWFVDGDKPFCG